jgi:hypothetical protein
MGPWRAGLEPLAAWNGAVRRPDSDSSPSWARGGRRTRQAGPARQRDNRGEEKKRAAWRKVGRGELLGRVERKEKERRAPVGCQAGLGRAVRDEEEAGWAGLQRRKEGENEKKKIGRAQREQKGEKEMLLNAFKFEFEI